ncbi:alpha/beta hydrolase [Polaribacter sejongensis]
MSLCKFRINRLLIVVFFVVFHSFIYGQKTSDLKILETFNYKKNVVYKVVDGVRLEMDIYYPDSSKIKKNNPWMLHVHGGGWAGGDRYKIFRKSFITTLKSLLDNGVVCATIEYRKTRGGSTAYEAVVDAKDAARYLLKNAKKYKLDKKNMVFGEVLQEDILVLLRLLDRMLNLREIQR